MIDCFRVDVDQYESDERAVIKGIAAVSDALKASPKGSRDTAKSSTVVRIFRRLQDPLLLGKDGRREGSPETAREGTCPACRRGSPP